MSWATSHIARLNAGETIKFRPRGNSMTGIVNDGQLVTVEPIGDRAVKRGDVVLCKVNGFQYLHLVKAVSADRVQIGNNHGHVNGWTMRKNVYGILIDVTD